MKSRSLLNIRNLKPLTWTLFLVLVTLAVPLTAQAQFTVTLTGIADTTTVAPNTTSNLLNFVPVAPCLPNAPATSDDYTALWGVGTGFEGAYVGRLSVTLHAVADLTTFIPSGTGTFGPAPSDPCSPSDPAISGANVAIRGFGPNDQQGV